MESKAVASSHFLSTKAGEDILRSGGNAYDATVATSAALTVVQPHLNGLGGDFFGIVDDGGVRAVNGNGYAAELATVEFFRSKGMTEIPKRGPLASFTVPGLVASWAVLAENCTMPLEKLLAPAISYAKEGFRVTPSIAHSISLSKGMDSDWEGIYRGISSGGTLYQKQLGRSLEAVAADCGHSFYHGEIARRIEEDMVRKGGLIRFSDMDAYEAVVTSPLRVKYRGYDVYTNPPSSQGATALMWLNMLERTDLASMSKADYYRSILETMKVAYAYRARYITDPARVHFDEKMLEPGYEYGTIQPVSGSAPSLSDTTAFSVYDGEVGISAIQSNYMGFGSGHNIAGTGINMNNRGVYFTLDADHHNALAPRKKTFHTLMATLAKGPRTIYTGSMGGDVQPQVNVQILCNMLDRGMGMQDAISAPRFAYPSSIYAGSEIYFERELGLGTGKDVDNNNSMMGHAQGILVSDVFEKGTDPRGDGLIRYD